MAHTSFLETVGLGQMNGELQAISDELIPIIERINARSLQVAAMLGSQMVIELDNAIYNIIQDLENELYRLDYLMRPQLHAQAIHQLIGDIVFYKNQFCVTAKDILDRTGGHYSDSIIRDCARQRFLMERYTQAFQAQREAIQNLPS